MNGVYGRFGILALIFLFALPLSLPAATIDELRDSIAARNADIARIEQEIAAYQKELDALGKQKQSLQGTIATLDVARKKLSATITATQGKIQATTLRIEELSFGIADKQTRIINSGEGVAESLRNLYALSNEPLILHILGGGDLSDIWQQIEDLNQFEESLRLHVEELNALKEDLEEKKTTSESEKKKLTALRSDLASQKTA